MGGCGTKCSWHGPRWTLFLASFLLWATFQVREGLDSLQKEKEMLQQRRGAMDRFADNFDLLSVGRTWRHQKSLEYWFEWFHEVGHIRVANRTLAILHWDRHGDSDNSDEPMHACSGGQLYYYPLFVDNTLESEWYHYSHSLRRQMQSAMTALNVTEAAIEKGYVKDIVWLIPESWQKPSLKSWMALDFDELRRAVYRQTFYVSPTGDGLHRFAVKQLPPPILRKLFGFQFWAEVREEINATEFLRVDIWVLTTAEFLREEYFKEQRSDLVLDIDLDFFECQTVAESFLERGGWNPETVDEFNAILSHHKYRPGHLSPEQSNTAILAMAYEMADGNWQSHSATNHSTENGKSEESGNAMNEESTDERVASETREDKAAKVPQIEDIIAIGISEGYHLVNINEALFALYRYQWERGEPQSAREFMVAFAIVDLMHERRQRERKVARAKMKSGDDTEDEGSERRNLLRAKWLDEERTVDWKTDRRWHYRLHRLLKTAENLETKHEAIGDLTDVEQSKYMLELGDEKLREMFDQMADSVLEEEKSETENTESTTKRVLLEVNADGSVTEQHIEGSAKNGSGNDNRSANATVDGSNSTNETLKENSTNDTMSWNWPFEEDANHSDAEMSFNNVEYRDADGDDFDFSFANGKLNGGGNEVNDKMAERFFGLKPWPFHRIADSFGLSTDYLYGSHSVATPPVRGNEALTIPPRVDSLAPIQRQFLARANHSRFQGFVEELTARQKQMLIYLIECSLDKGRCEQFGNLPPFFEKLHLGHELDWSEVSQWPVLAENGDTAHTPHITLRRVDGRKEHAQMSARIDANAPDQFHAELGRLARIVTRTNARVVAAGIEQSRGHVSRKNARFIECGVFLTLEHSLQMAKDQFIRYAIHGDDKSSADPQCFSHASDAFIRELVKSNIYN